MKLSEQQAVEFLRESNAIEGYEFPPQQTVDAWRSWQDVDEPLLKGHAQALYDLTHSSRWLLSQKLSFSRIEQLHATLMQDLLPVSKLGLRQVDVRVGNRICPSYAQVRQLLKVWINKANSLKKPTEKQLWETHLAFERIHPFVDGNGRSGRLLWLWLRFKYGHKYAVVENATKWVLYYPEFDRFPFSTWINT